MRARPSVLSTRTTRAERALVQVVAEQEGITVAEWIHRVVTTTARGKLASELGAAMIGAAAAPGE